MAALGSTADPDALVPGSLITVRADASALRARSAQLDDAATALARVRVPGWDGTSADAFSKKFSAEPRHWRKTADALTTAAAKLETYARVLAAAKTDAANAIELWAAAEASSKAGARTYNAAVSVYEGSMNTTSPVPSPGAFSDPGAEGRDRAEQLLDDAQGAVRRAGDDAADGLAEIVISDSPIVDKEANGDMWGKSGKTSGSLFTIDPQMGKKKMKWNLDFAKAEGEAHFLEGDASAGVKRGAAYATAAAAGAIAAKGSAAFGMKDEKFSAKAEGSAVVEGNASARAGYKDVNAGVGVSASAGVEAALGVTAGKDGVEAVASAGVLAKAGVEGDVEVAGVGGKVKAEAMAGYGYEAKAGAIHNVDGSWTMGFTAGLAVDVGLSVSPSITLNPTEMLDGANDAADFFGSLVD
ncbi:putative T7SS-secreted protein [Pengzhenrongella sp.]|jgi:uncharacterized protein YukE|uniref:putative T7SS-secreted protein n=1 Tax=Pengzhenrongella sp. TaxID=2888820 RepID=UPI002F93A27C